MTADGWIARDIADRDRGLTGDYTRAEWRRYCQDHRIDILMHPLIQGRPAYLIDDTLVLRCDLSEAECCHYAWEEIGHHATSVGNREFWRTRPQGEVTLRKMERRARQYRTFRPTFGNNKPPF